MPGRLNREDRWLWIAGGGVFAALVTVSIIFGAAQPDQNERPTTWSVHSGGAKAIYLLLPSLGYQVDRWVQPPDELTDAARTTLILAAPDDPPTPDERKAIATFLARGGRVVATGATGAHFLTTARVERIFSSVPVTRAQSLSPSAQARAAASIALSPESAWPEKAPAAALYGDGGRVLVVQMASSEGEAYWWASATPLTNAGLSEPGNLEFVLATLGAPGERRVLFDEYFHGARPTLAASFLATPAKWFLVQLFLIAVVVSLTYTRRSGPIVVPAAESRLSSLEYVRTMGSLYRRAGATVVPIEAASRRLRTLLTQRLGLRSDAGTADFELALRDRWHLDEAAVAPLRACDVALGGNPPQAPAKALALVRAVDELYLAVHSPRKHDRENH